VKRSLVKEIETELKAMKEGRSWPERCVENEAAKFADQVPLEIRISKKTLATLRRIARKNLISVDDVIEQLVDKKS